MAATQACRTHLKFLSDNQQLLRRQCHHLVVDLISQLLNLYQLPICHVEVIRVLVVRTSKCNNLTQTHVVMNWALRMYDPISKVGVIQIDSDISLGCT